MTDIEELKRLLPDTAHKFYIEQADIRATEPCGDIQSAAHILVTERHGKFALVDLVAHLLVRVQAAEMNHDVQFWRADGFKTELETAREELEAAERDAARYRIERDAARTKADHFVAVLVAAPREDWPDNFAVDPECDVDNGSPPVGVWTHCQHCGAGGLSGSNLPQVTP